MSMFFALKVVVRSSVVSGSNQHVVGLHHLKTEIMGSSARYSNQMSSNGKMCLSLDLEASC